MSEQKQEPSLEGLRLEYIEAVQTIRHYGNLRLALFSIFFAVIGGVGLVAFGMFHLFFGLLTVLWVYAVFAVPLGS